tara:strand:- start:313 stop:549 length:237 start_codon:yes stop_codon:yes gene_type:complete
MAKICAQTNIPTVDNTAPDCEAVTKEQCVLATTQRLVPFTINIGDSYQDIIDQLLVEIKALQDRATINEARLTILETP